MVVYNNWSQSRDRGRETWLVAVWQPRMCRFGHLLALCIYKWPRGEPGEGVQPSIDEHPGAPCLGSPGVWEAQRVRRLPPAASAAWPVVIMQGIKAGGGGRGVQWHHSIPAQRPPSGWVTEMNQRRLQGEPHAHSPTRDWKLPWHHHPARERKSE